MAKMRWAKALLILAVGCGWALACEDVCKQDADCSGGWICSQGRCAPKDPTETVVSDASEKAQVIETTNEPTSPPDERLSDAEPTKEAEQPETPVSSEEISTEPASPPEQGTETTPPPTACAAEGGVGAVAKPVFVKQIQYTGTSWYGSPAVVDLDGDGKKEIVGTFYDVFVWDAQGKELARAKSGEHHQGRVYAPGVVADLDGDGVFEVVVGGSRCSVAAYEYKGGKLQIKAGWPVKACAVRESSVEVRGMAAADLDGDGKLEVVVTTTQNGEDAQVWVYQADGKLYQPKGLTKWQAWPRYNKLTGEGNDADANTCGHQGYGAYGLNVAIGNIDNEPDQEILVTYDNHHIQAFKHDGKAILASPYFKNRSSKCSGSRMSWGQFIRWLEPSVEENHYNKQTGEWPHPKTQIWLQWTASPPVVADLNRDGKNEVIGVPNAEKNEPYETQFYAFFVLEGAFDPQRSAMRLAGWEDPPRGGKPQTRPAGYYPPDGIPSPTVVDLDGDGKPEVIAPLNDGFIHVLSSTGQPLWRFDYRHGRPLLYASEVVVADLNKDGRPELIFSTWGAPKDPDAGWLVILDAQGKLLHDVKLPVGTNGNGAGYPAAPTLADIDGNGDIEILLQSFGVGFHIYRVPNSGTKCLLWPTARANYLRNAQGPAYQRTP